MTSKRGMEIVRRLDEDEGGHLREAFAATGRACRRAPAPSTG